MIEKWERHPQRIGMVLGFVALPLLSFLRNNILTLLLLHRTLPAHISLISLFYNSFYGLILGAGASVSLAASRRGDFALAKRALLRSGIAVVMLVALTSSLGVWQNWPRPAPGTSFGPVTFYGIQFSWWAFPFFLYMVWSNLWNLALHCALLLLFIGILMRSRR